MKIQSGLVTQERDIAAESDFMNVPWQIIHTVEGSEEVVTLLEGVQAFPLTTTQEEITDFLKRKLETYKENLALHEGAKELQAGIANATEVSGQVSNITIE